jgi:hypothetical protein
MRHTRWLQELYWICPMCGLKVLDGDCEMTKTTDEMNFIMECPQCKHESVI